MKKVIDLTQTIVNDMPVYPGDEKVELKHTKFLKEDKHNNHRLEISMHVGTHIDAPMHMTECRAYISDFSPESFIGKGCVLDVRNQSVINMKAEYEELVEENCFVLLYTGFDSIYGTTEYYEKHPIVSEELGEFFLRKKIKMLGVDAPSPDRAPFEIHKKLFSEGIFIVENLTKLESLLPLKEFEVIALPMKIRADGAMARVIAREK